MPIAIVRGPAKATNLPSRIRVLFAEFYAGFTSKGESNIVFYPEWDVAGEFAIGCGVLVESGGNSATPAGTIVTTVHIGPYSQLSGAHQAIHEWGARTGTNSRVPRGRFTVTGTTIRLNFGLIFSICWLDEAGNWEAGRLRFAHPHGITKDERASYDENKVKHGNSRLVKMPSGGKAYRIAGAVPGCSKVLVCR